MDNLSQIIEEHNLSIRRLPDKVISRYDIRHFKEGDEVVEINGRKFAKRTTIPEHAGWYLVKQINNTMTTVHWSFKTDFLAKTLEESIELFLESLKM